MARTYTLHKDIEKMRTAGLAIGGNLNNAIVVDKHKILNPVGLRLEKEFVKHKTLDCIGVFYLLGMDLIGDINCFAPGHNLNQQLIKEILKNQENYRIEDIIIEDHNNKYIDLNSNNENEPDNDLSYLQDNESDNELDNEVNNTSKLNQEEKIILKAISTLK